MAVEDSTMKFFLSWALVGLSAVCIVTCGGNVVVDPHSARAMGGSMVGTGPGMPGIGGNGTAGSFNGLGGSTIGCVSDADCPAGEVCDTSTGMCMGTDPGGCHQCACVDLLSSGGCADICDLAQNGTNTPNFCNGVPALPQCAQCLADRCSLAIPSDPAGCM
jgi:Cys-rich repeat protein